MFCQVIFFIFFCHRALEYEDFLGYYVHAKNLSFIIVIKNNYMFCCIFSFFSSEVFYP